MGIKGGDNMPGIFYVNWFRKDENGKFLWPGFGDNIRVLKWIFERLDGAENYFDSPIGRLPAEGSIDISGLNLDENALKKLFEIDKDQGINEADEIMNYLEKFSSRLPEEIKGEAIAAKERFMKN